MFKYDEALYYIMKWSKGNRQLYDRVISIIPQLTFDRCFRKVVLLMDWSYDRVGWHLMDGIIDLYYKTNKPYIAKQHLIMDDFIYEKILPKSVVFTNIMMNGHHYY